MISQYSNFRTLQKCAPLEEPYQAEEEMKEQQTTSHPGRNVNGESCQEQCFEKRQYPVLAVRRITEGLGTGGTGVHPAWTV